MHIVIKTTRCYYSSKIGLVSPIVSLSDQVFLVHSVIDVRYMNIHSRPLRLVAATTKLERKHRATADYDLESAERWADPTFDALAWMRKVHDGFIVVLNEPVRRLTMTNRLQ